MPRILKGSGKCRTWPRTHTPNQKTLRTGQVSAASGWQQKLQGQALRQFGLVKEIPEIKLVVNSRRTNCQSAQFKPLGCASDRIRELGIRPRAYVRSRSKKGTFQTT